MGLSRGEQGVLESFHGAFDRGKLDRILSESMLVGFEAPGSCFFPFCGGDAVCSVEVCVFALI